MTCECIGIYFSGCIYGEILTNYIDFMFLGCAPVAGFFLAVGSVHRGAVLGKCSSTRTHRRHGIGIHRCRGTPGSKRVATGKLRRKRNEEIAGPDGLGVTGACRHASALFPTPAGSRNCHCWGLGVCLARRTCTAAPHPATQPATPAKAQRKGWGRGASGGQKRSGLASLPARRPHRGWRCVVSPAHCFGPGDRLRPVRSAPPAARAVEAADRMKTSR
jgi:hypothetical protein